MQGATCQCKNGVILGFFSGASCSDRIFGLLNTIASEVPSENDIKQLMAHKLVVLAGDLSKPCLGVSESVYGTLQQEVSHIIHCGAVVNSVLPYSGWFC